MSLNPSKLQLTPSVCLHLLCLLLLLLNDSSCTAAVADPPTAELLTQKNTALLNCSGACDVPVSDNATLKNLSEASSTQGPTLTPRQKLTSVLVSNNDTVVSDTLPSHSPTASPTNEQPVSSETKNESAAFLTSTTPGLPTQTAHAGSISNTSTITDTATPVGNVQTTTVPGTSTTPTLTPTVSNTTTGKSAVTPAITTTQPTSTPMTTAATPHPVTTVKETVTLPSVNRTVTVFTTTGMKKSPPSSSAATTQPNASGTGPPPVQATSLPTGPSTVTVTSTITPTSHNKSVVSGTKVAPLTRQPGDTASLLAVLLFGLLFFLVTVAVFVTQAYESYRRKDYTQVDYLINGMYTDSGV